MEASPFLHICEVCGLSVNLTAEAAFNEGWVVARMQDGMGPRAIGAAFLRKIISPYGMTEMPIEGA